MPVELRTEHDAAWKQRFRLPETHALQLARANPTCGLVGSNLSGKRHLYAWDVTSGKLDQLTHKTDGVWFGVLSPDGRYVYYLDDQQGDEIGHLVRIPYEGGQAEDITPDMLPYAVPFESDIFGLSISQDAASLGFTTAIDGVFHLYHMELGADGGIGEPRELYEATKLVIGPRLSYAGEIGVLASTETGDGMQYSLLAFDTATGQQMATLQDEASSMLPVMFSPIKGDSRFLATTNRSGYSRPLIWNPRTGERLDLALEELEGEVFPYDWSADGNRLLLMQYAQAVQHLYIYDLSAEKLIRQAHPLYGYIGSAFFGPEGEIIVTADNAAHPVQVIALDAQVGAEQRVLLSTTVDGPSGHPLRSVTFPSSDGQVIQAWLGVPEGEGPFPTIVETHGGPTGVASSGFWPSAQAWLDAGFAYITVNYRGSTTFGRAFEEQIWGDIGHWEVEDMVAARNWLVEQGIAEPESIFPTGWSYGGYLTLHAISKYPKLWAGGMAGVAVADCTLAYEDEADTLKAYDVTLFKGTPQEQPELYRSASPITYAAQVQAPILIIQGRNDTRCPPRQVEVYEAKMKELGKDIEVHWFDAGHVSLDIEQEIEDQERFMRFAYRVLNAS